MQNNESILLQNALLYEEGHPRRTQHILKVYAVAKLLGELEQLSEEEQLLLRASAILHDIAIKYCKEHYQGNACQEYQCKELPQLVEKFLTEANYCPTYIPKVIDLTLNHHNYNDPPSLLLQLLIEADLIVNRFESSWNQEQVERMVPIFKTSFGKELFQK